MNDEKQGGAKPAVKIALYNDEHQAAGEIALWRKDNAEHLSGYYRSGRDAEPVYLTGFPAEDKNRDGSPAKPNKPMRMRMKAGDDKFEDFALVYPVLEKGDGSKIDKPFTSVSFIGKDDNGEKIDLAGRAIVGGVESLTGHVVDGHAILRMPEPPAAAPAEEAEDDQGAVPTA